MALVITPESPMGIELLKWEKPYKFRPYPKMLYKARHRPDGVISVSETNDYLKCFIGGDGQVRAGTAEAFSASCQRIVGSDSERETAINEGWRDTPAEAIDHLKALDEAVADAAAHRYYEDRNMSDKAKAEASSKDTGMEHVPVIPEAPRRRGRPRKNPLPQ